jgi:hypothetical protein
LPDSAKATAFQVFVPSDSSFAGTLKAVANCPGGELVLEFSSGIRIYENTNVIPNPAAAWEAMAADSPLDTSTGSIQGQPAALIEPDKGGANGSITFVQGGTWIVVEGNGALSLDDLESVASSLMSYEQSP